MRLAAGDDTDSKKQTSTDYTDYTDTRVSKGSVPGWEEARRC